MIKGARTIAEAHPSVEPDVRENMNRISATIKTQVPQSCAYI